MGIMVCCQIIKLCIQLCCVLTKLKIETGPFRRTCEISLGLLRQNEDSLMTILETFLHDPTTDFIGKRVSLSLMLIQGPDLQEYRD